MQEGVIKQFNIDDACGAYLAVEGWEADVANCEDKGVGSETERGIVNTSDEMRAALKR